MSLVVIDAIQTGIIKMVKCFWCNNILEKTKDKNTEYYCKTCCLYYVNSEQAVDG